MSNEELSLSAETQAALDADLDRLISQYGLAVLEERLNSRKAQAAEPEEANSQPETREQLRHTEIEFILPYGVALSKGEVDTDGNIRSIEGDLLNENVYGPLSAGDFDALSAAGVTVDFRGGGDEAAGYIKIKASDVNEALASGRLKLQIDQEDSVELE